MQITESDTQYHNHKQSRTESTGKDSASPSPSLPTASRRRFSSPRSPLSAPSHPIAVAISSPLLTVVVCSPCPRCSNQTEAKRSKPTRFSHCRPLEMQIKEHKQSRTESTDEDSPSPSLPGPSTPFLLSSVSIVGAVTPHRGRHLLSSPYRRRVLAVSSLSENPKVEVVEPDGGQAKRIHQHQRPSQQAAASFSLFFAVLTELQIV